MVPSANLQPGGVVHLPFTKSEVEGSTGATVVTTNPDVSPSLFDFTDSAGSVTDYRVTVTWGDGSVSTGSANAAAPFLVMPNGPGAFQIVPTSALADAHIYEDTRDIGTVFAVQVTDIGTSATTGKVGTPFTALTRVTDPSLTLSTMPSVSVHEGDSNTLTVAQFTDPGNTTGLDSRNPGPNFFDFDQTAANPDYTATITWGDGTANSVVDSFNNPDAFEVVSHTAVGTTYAISAPHVYAEESVSNNVVVSVAHGSGSVSATTLNVAVLEATPVVNANSGVLPSINEGDSTPANTVVGAFTDSGNLGGFDPGQTAAAPEYTVTINWGDASDTLLDPNTILDSFNNPQAFGFDAATRTFSVIVPAHKYAEEGTFNVTMTVSHGGLNAQGVTQQITVNEVPLVVSSFNESLTVSKGSSTPGLLPLLKFTDPGGVESPYFDYTATIHWGDGATSDGTFGQSSFFAVLAGPHVYANEGVYSVTVDLGHDSAPIQTIVGATITVIDDKPKATININPYSGTYDGQTHGLSGTAMGSHGEDLSNLLSFGPTYVHAGHYVVNWSFAGNGSYAGASGTSTIDVAPRGLTISAGGQDKVYDGTILARVSLSDNRLAGDQLIDSDSGATFEDKNVGTGKTINVSGLSISGPSAGDYALANTTSSTTGSITPRTLTVTATGQDRVYDGTTAATVTLSDDRAASDTFTETYGSANFSDKNSGSHKSVTVSGIAISGGDAGNYTLGITTATTTAAITLRTATLTGITANDKVYDGTHFTTVNTAGTTIIGVIPADRQDFNFNVDRATGYFSDKNAGTGKTVFVSRYRRSAGNRRHR
jgi:hypothetical protein